MAIEIDEIMDEDFSEKDLRTKYAKKIVEAIQNFAPHQDLLISSGELSYLFIEIGIPRGQTQPVFAIIRPGGGSIWSENVQRNALAWMPIEADNFKESLKEIVKEVEEYYGREIKLYVTNTARQSACTQIYL